MKILITGGAGFIGSHLCEFYIKQGMEVWCIDNLLTGNEKNISPFLKDPNFHFLKEDITKFDFSKISVNFDIIFHLSSPASPPDYFNFPIETLWVNSIGTEVCLKLTQKYNAKFLFSSTSEVYGDPLVSPQKEDYWGNVNSIGLRSVYDEGKRYGEAITMAYHRKFNLNTHLIRIFNTYGPNMRLNDGRVIPNFIYQSLTSQPFTIYGDGKQTRSFCYIDDLIAGITKLIQTDYNLPVNLGNPDEFTILELAEKLKSILKKEIPIKFLPPIPDDPRKRKPDISLAKKLLKWEPGISLQDGLQKTIESLKIQMEAK
jgi:dTDP-glucose 4,6-dehydratase